MSRSLRKREQTEALGFLSRGYRSPASIILDDLDQLESADGTGRIALNGDDELYVADDLVAYSF
jgi:hypothetical protein